MKTLQQFSKLPRSIPMATAWLAADISEAFGKQELFTKQSPQILKVLREHALIESAVSSNRIEGVVIDRSRIATVIHGKSPLRDRDEAEVRGYRDALNLIHEKGSKLPVSERTLLRLHRLSHPASGDAGRYREKESNIVETYADGRSRVRFKTVAPGDTRPYIRGLLELWRDSLQERWLPPVITMAAVNLDFLCTHPFRDGNGRVSRLLLLLQCYHLGYEVGRYISLERLIEENKERYYETLEQSSQGWHEGKHDPWPYINYVLFIVKTAYRQFEQRVGEIKAPKGAKSEMVMSAIRAQTGEFRLADIEHACPGVGREWIRALMSKLREAGELECSGKGPAARWSRRKKSARSAARSPGKEKSVTQRIAPQRLRRSK